MEQGTGAPQTSTHTEGGIAENMQSRYTVTIAIILYLVEPKTSLVRHVIILCAAEKEKMRPFHLQ